MICDDLIQFVDGELSRARSDGFRLHLASCKSCSVHLLWELQIAAHLSQLTPAKPHSNQFAIDALCVVALLAAAVLLIGVL